MLRIFGSKPILSSEDAEFQEATFKWLLKNFGGKDFYGDTKLVLPNKSCFPSKVGSEREAASATFETVKKYAGMEQWPCRLERQEDDIDVRLASALAVENVPKSPLGTFEAIGHNDIVITYNPEIVGNPTQLVATYAHELAHYLTGAGPEEPPGGWDNWEFATDIAATFLGFGIFMANSAFSFRQYTDVDSHGWQYSRNGYLSEDEHVFALAVFLGLKAMPLDSALPYLKRELRRPLKRAMKQIAQSGLINELAAIEYEPPAHVDKLQLDA